MKSFKILIIGSILFMGYITNVFCQTLAEGKMQLEMLQYKKAQSIFMALIQNDITNNTDYYYYLGKTLLARNKVDSAKIFFNKGISLNAENPLNYIGLADAALSQKNTTEANAQFLKAKELTKSKNYLGFITLAETYLKYAPIDTNWCRSANEVLAKAKKIDDKAEIKDPYLRILQGDVTIIKNKQDGGKAMSFYESASYVNEKFILAYLKTGDIWFKIRNPKLAVESYNKALELNPSYLPALLQMGDLYYMAGQYGKSIENYKSYLSKSEKDLDTEIRLALVYFLNKEYEKSTDLANKVKKEDSTNVGIFRLIGYSSFENSNFAEGVNAMQKFFTKAQPEKIKTDDYVYYGKLLYKNGQDSLGILELRKALEKDSSLTEIHPLLAEIYNKNGKYLDAADQFQQKIKKSTKINANDYFNLGRAYYNAKEFILADSAFKQFIQYNSNFPPAYKMRAICYANMDTTSELGIANIHWETFIQKAIEIDSIKYKNDIFDAYGSLAFYYIKKNNKKTARTYLDKMIAIKPDDANVKELLKKL